MRASIAGWLRASLLACTLASPLAHAQHAYRSAEAAAEAFTDALRKVDRAALGKVLGANYKQFIKTDGVERADIEAYLAAWDKQHKLNTEGDKATVAVGDGGWTLPIPIVKRKAGWQFDVIAGADEMRTRRIGRNELTTIRAILAYYDAQREYSAVDRNGDVYVTGFNPTGAGTGKIAVFDNDGDLLRVLDVVAPSAPQPSSALLGIDFHPDTRQLLVVDIGTGTVWSVDPFKGTAMVFTTIPDLTPNVLSTLLV